MEYIFMDDNSSSQNILRWDYEEAIKAGKLTEFARTAGGKRKNNKGKLPLSHPPWTKLADHNHHMQCLAAQCYKHVHAALSETLLTTADAERLKCNCCYVVHKFKSYDFATFKDMIGVVLYHPFGVHDTCGD
jgi:hypothetical protein